MKDLPLALKDEIARVVEELAAQEMTLSRLRRRHAILREASHKLGAGWKADTVLAEIWAHGEDLDAAPAAKGAA